MSTAIPLSPTLGPEDVIEHLRTVESQLESVVPLTKEQRKLLKSRIRNQPRAVVEASINVVGVLGNVSQAIGHPLDEVRQLQDETVQREAAADQTRAFLNALEGANLVRRERLALIATQAYTRTRPGSQPPLLYAFGVVGGLTSTGTGVVVVTGAGATGAVFRRRETALRRLTSSRCGTSAALSGSLASWVAIADDAVRGRSRRQKPRGIRPDGPDLEGGRHQFRRVPPAPLLR